MVRAGGSARQVADSPRARPAFLPAAARRRYSPPAVSPPPPSGRSGPKFKEFFAQRRLGFLAPEPSPCATRLRDAVDFFGDCRHSADNETGLIDADIRRGQRARHQHRSRGAQRARRVRLRDQSQLHGLGAEVDTPLAHDHMRLRRPPRRLDSSDTLGSASLMASRTVFPASCFLPASKQSLLHRQ